MADDPTDDPNDDETEAMAAMTRKLAREDGPDDLEKASHDVGDAPASTMARQKSQVDDGNDDANEDASAD